jgi:hypothetical protein
MRDTHEPSNASLAIAILRDLVHLVDQQFKLTRHEITRGVRQRVIAAAVCGAAVVLALLSAVELSVAAAHLLHWSTGPVGFDPAQLPLWACHGIVAAVLLAAGAICWLVGKAKYRAIEPIRFSVSDMLP